MLGVSMHEGWIANSGGHGYLLAQVAPPERPERGAWPLQTVETEVNEVSKRTNERGPFLGWFVVLVVSLQEIFVLPHGCSGRPHTISITLYPSPSKLDRQPCWVSCLLVCVSGHPSPRCLRLYIRERN
jgi:hypothetical protein